MPVPKKKTSKAKRDSRRAHHHLPVKHAVTCPNCGESMLLHRACPHCGHYRGREVLEIEDVE